MRFVINCKQKLWETSTRQKQGSVRACRLGDIHAHQYTNNDYYMREVNVFSILIASMRKKH